MSTLPGAAAAMCAVIPAKAGISRDFEAIPAFAGMTGGVRTVAQVVSAMKSGRMSDSRSSDPAANPFNSP